MSRFADKNGTDWIVEITVTTVAQCRSELEVDLLDTESTKESPSLLVRLYQDPVVLVNVLYIVCRQQAEERSVSDAAFGRLFDGPSVERATDAIMEALVNFTPNPRQRARAQRELNQIRAGMDRMQDVADKVATEEAVEIRINKELRLFEERLQKELGDSSGSSPESSESIPDRTP